jgi:hypothetical protein
MWGKMTFEEAAEPGHTAQDSQPGKKLVVSEGLLHADYIQLAPVQRPSGLSIRIIGSGGNPGRAG